MNDEKKMIFLVDDGPRYANLWVLVLLAALWVLSLVLRVPGMP